MDEVPIVTAFLRERGDVLLLRRGDAVGPSRGRWGAVAGPLAPENDAPPRDAETAALAAIAEETGLRERVSLARAGDPFPVTDEERGVRWVVHPLLFDCDSREAATNGETAAEWCPPTEVLRRDTVPGLWAAYDRVRPTVASVTADREHGSTYVSLRALEVLRDEAALAGERASEGTGTRGAWEDLLSTARDLRAARPSMRAVVTRVDRAVAAAADEGTPTALERAATAGIEDATAADGEAAATAAALVGDRVLTLSRSGTVLAMLSRAAPDAVYVAESRPGGEGRGVAEALAAGDDPPAVTLFADAAFGHVLAAESVDAVLVGADAVLADGSVVNKVGTCPAALAAARADVPVYAVAAAAKVAPDDHPRFESGDPAAVYDGDAPVRALNPTFDRTPADLLAGVATERGLLDADGVARVAAEHAHLATWADGDTGTGG